ncbi:MAG: hypothetical protein Q9174_006392, partial [Haloplaca sp. 1 TL-2023]
PVNPNRTRMPKLNEQGRVLREEPKEKGRESEQSRAETPKDQYNSPSDVTPTPTQHKVPPFSRLDFKQPLKGDGEIDMDAWIAPASTGSRPYAPPPQRLQSNLAWSPPPLPLTPTKLLYPRDPIRKEEPHVDQSSGTSPPQSPSQLPPESGSALPSSDSLESGSESRTTMIEASLESLRQRVIDCAQMKPTGFVHWEQHVDIVDFDLPLSTSEVQLKLMEQLASRETYMGNAKKPRIYADPRLVDLNLLTLWVYNNMHMYADDRWPPDYEPKFMAKGDRAKDEDLVSDVTTMEDYSPSIASLDPESRVPSPGRLSQPP